MSIDTNLHGRLRNTSLPASNGIHPLYEAVSNSIHAIEDAGLSAEEGEIVVHIIRDEQMTMNLDERDKRPGPEAKNEIIGFKVNDNGIGFNDANLESFQTLDSEYKIDRGGRGVGRLLWLKAFERAEVDSIFQNDDGALSRRSFTFDVHQGVSKPKTIEADNAKRETKIHLEKFLKRYREAAPKTAKVIAKNLFEHCLWYFVRSSGVPKIKIVDGDETVSLEEIHKENMVESATIESINLKEKSFELIHVKFLASSTRNHSIAFCAANRLVTQESIKGKIPGLFSNLRDEAGDFVYECYVSSPLLDDRVRSERMSFDIEEEPLGLFADNELSKKEIREAVLEHASAFLADYLTENRRLGKERVTTFVSQNAPRYRPILSRIPDEQLAVDPDISNRDLDLLLHGHFVSIESQLLADGHNMMNPKKGETDNSYQNRLRAYLEIVEDIKKSDLANYVAHRKVILDLLENAIQQKRDGKYEREDLIHNLIMPMGNTSDDIHFDICNLWLIDERLAFHDYLASDKKISAMPITESNEPQKPDIIAYNTFDNPVLASDTQKLPLASIVIIELKRPMRNDAAAGEEKDPIEQALGYLERIRSGVVKTKLGRPIPKSEDVPGFCYVICDITPTVEKRCKLLGLTLTHDYSGYFGYNPNYRAYIEVISFDRLLNAAKERNKAFFDKLQLPTT